jgi:hypothetical protein
MRAIQANPDDAARPIPGGRPLAQAGTPALARLAQAQGAYYFLSGAWPLLAPASFQAVTGPKFDFWLVETVGLILVVAGAVLFLAGRAHRVTREIALLGAALAAVLGSIDIWCVLEPHTTRAYWFDAVVQLGLLGAWAALLARRDADAPE